MDDIDDRHALLASIGSLTQRKEDLLQEMSTIEHELATQTAKYARMLNADSFIYRLPNELLTDILLICQRASLSPHPRKKPTVPFQVTASHVSHRWRAVVIATPLLWNTIDLHIRIENHAQGRMQAQLAAHLARSGACFIDVTLEFVFMSLAEPYFDMLSRHALRWRRLSVATNHENVSAFNRLLLDVHAPMLEHLSLSETLPHGPADGPRNAAHAPLLSFVRLAGYALGTLHPPLSTVTTLHLDGWTRHYITPEQLRAVLGAAPRLAHLSLNQLLRIRGPCSPAARFLGLVDVPGLRALALQGVDTFDCGVLPSVRALALEGCALDEVDIMGLFRALPGVECFSVDESLPDMWEMLLPEELHTLVLRELQNMDVSHFCYLVSRLHNKDMDEVDTADSVGGEYKSASAAAARSGPPQGLAKVCLDRRSRTVLRSKHRLTWLEECVVVEHRDLPEAWPQGLGYVDAHDLLE
ncbi:hypothetical protein BJ912DRAFT_1023099 [Pholiota molesta]|nr:hypothetical protein BJ912DRAFT_1023099 [Pholiota molesta]